MGNFKLQISCDSYDTNPANWVDLASTTVAAGGAVGSHIYNITDAGYGWVRVSYTNSSGDGSAEIRATVKGV